MGNAGGHVCFTGGGVARPRLEDIFNSFSGGLFNHRTSPAPAQLLSTLGEEIIYRGFFQERLIWFIGSPLAVLLVSIIFARSKNVLVAWIAHTLADIVAMALIVM